MCSFPIGASLATDARDNPALPRLASITLPNSAVTHRLVLFSFCPNRRNYQDGAIEKGSVDARRLSPN